MFKKQQVLFQAKGMEYNTKGAELTFLDPNMTTVISGVISQYTFSAVTTKCYRDASRTELYTTYKSLYSSIFLQNEERSICGEPET